MSDRHSTLKVGDRIMMVTESSRRYKATGLTMTWDFGERGYVIKNEFGPDLVTIELDRRLGQKARKGSVRRFAVCKLTALDLLAEV
jgi:hypothetical protein